MFAPKFNNKNAKFNNKNVNTTNTEQ